VVSFRGERLGIHISPVTLTGIPSILQQLAAIGLILIMLGAIQKKIFVWKTGFWGADGFGWYYDLTLTSALTVILVTDGGKLVLLH